MKTSTNIFLGLFLYLFFSGQQLHAQIKITDTKIGINRANPNVAIDALGLNPDDAALLNLANSDETHQLLFFPGRLNDPNPYIQWTDGDPLRFATTQGGFTEWMRIQPDGNVGIGTNFPLELLDVDGNVKAIKFIGDGSMLTNLNSDNNWTTYGEAPIIFGFNNTVAGDSSSAVGYENEATGLRSSAFGYFNEATGDFSSAFGNVNVATGDRSSAFGYVNEATGDRSSAFGYVNDATGDRSSAFGYINDAIGDQSSAFGHGTLSDVYGLMAVGRYNADPVGSATTWVDTEAVFVIGNGKDFLDRSTAVTVLKNGDVGIGTTDPKGKLHVTGTYYGFGDIRLHAHDGDGNNGIAYVQARDDSGTSDLSLQFRTQNNGTIVDALKITNDGDVGIGTINPDSKLEVVASSSSGSSNVATFRNSTSGVGSIKILGEEFSSVKFIDSGSGSVTESDFEIASIGDGRLVIRNADNANDGFGAFESIALFEPMSQTYQFVVFGDALASGGTFINSDQRLKRNINNLNNALDHLMQLQPKRYEYDYSNEKYAYLNLPTEPQIGLIAQEVEQIFPELVKTNNLNKEGKDDDIAKLGELEEVDGLKAINYVALVPVLIGAVQEQQTQIEAKDELIEVQNEKIENLENRLAKIEALLSGNINTNAINTTTTTLTSATLSQNAPNPFDEVTRIDYFIPENVNSASLQVLDQNGHIIKTIPIQATGKGQITLQANLLSAGTYSYSLILDGRVIETKQMVLTH